jgi:hypothetical protein
MKTRNLALIGVLVGAIGLAPTGLSLAQAEVSATSSASSTQVSTKQYVAVAGSSPAATAPTAYSVPAFTTSCAVSNKTSGANNSPKTVLNMGTITGYVVGMRPIATGIPGSALITSINVASKTITISVATTSNISNNTSITGAGCWNQYFNVNNTQTTALNSFGIQQSFTSISPDIITMQSCAGTWTESTGACSGTITTIVTSSTTSAITTVPTALAALTGTARLRLLSTKSGVSVSISVAIRLATDIATGTTTNS